MPQYPAAIDLGTTYSCIGVWMNDRVEIIANDQGNRITPSYVSFSDSERLVGDAAKNQMLMDPCNTVFDAKRLIGRKWSDKTVQEDMKLWPFKVIQGPNDKPLIQVTWQGATKRFTPEEISAMVLTKMKTTAEDFLGTQIKDVVVTVPAYFSESQRAATKDAGTIAGLNVVRIINEPTAAALAYGIGQAKNAKSQCVLVIDCGGGTHDITLLSIDDGVFEVLSSFGLAHMGGEDFDNRMLQYFAEEFKRKHKSDLLTNKKAVRRLKAACERAKRSLSSATSATIELDSLHEGVDFYSNITRAKFEDLCGDLFRECISPIDKVLVDGKKSKGDVDEIILVGGSTRIPKLQQLIKDCFNGKELNRSVNADEAVAAGATVQAAILAGVQSEQTKDLLLLDVCPLSLGIEANHGIMAKIIECNTTIPTKKSETFTTASDNQSTVEICIYEGERPMAKDNRLLGKFQLTDIPPAPRGTPKIEVVVEIDANGLVNVTATESASGKKNNVTIKNENDRLSKEEVERMMAEAAKYKQQDEQLKAVLDARNSLEHTCYSAKSSLDGYGGNNSDKALDVGKKEQLIKLIEDNLAWLSDTANSSVTVADCKQRQSELDKLLTATFAPLYGNNGAAGGFDPTSFAGPGNFAGFNGNGGNQSGPTVEEVD